MIKKLNLEKKGMNLKTKIIISLFFLLSIIYLLDKFFDNYTFVSPIKKLEFQFIIQPRVPALNYPKNNRKTPKKADKISVRYVGKSVSQPHPTSQNLAKFSGIKLYHDRDLAGYEAIYVYFGNDKTAYAVAMAESGVNCKKIGYLVCDKAGKCFKSNEPQDYGLFQINKVHLWRFKKFGGDPLNCWDNAKVAKEIYEEQGWHPWSAFKNKSFLSYL